MPGLFPSPLTPFPSAPLFQRVSLVSLQKFTTQRDRRFKVNAVNPDILKNYPRLYMRTVGAGQTSNIPVAIKPAYLLSLFFLPHETRIPSGGHSSLLAQEHNKEYKMYEDTTGNKCLLSSLPKTPKCRGPESLRFWVHARGREEELTILKKETKRQEINKAGLLRFSYTSDHLWITWKCRF